MKSRDKHVYYVESCKNARIWKEKLPYGSMERNIATCNRHCQGHKHLFHFQVIADPSLLYGVSVIEESKLRESGSSYYGFPQNYDGYEEEDNEEAATTTGSGSSTTDDANYVLQQCLRT